MSSLIAVHFHCKIMFRLRQDSWCNMIPMRLLQLHFSLQTWHLRFHFLLCWAHLPLKSKFRQRFQVLYFAMHGRLVRAHQDHVLVVLLCIWTWVFLNPPPFHALRAKGESILWSPRPRPVPSSRGHYASYPGNSSLVTVPKSAAPATLGLQAVPKKAHVSIRASTHAGHSPTLPSSVACNFGQGQQSAAFPKQVIHEGSAPFLSSASH